MQSELLQRIERAAAAGQPVPKDLRPPEAMLFHMLQGVYAAYQAGKLTKEQGHEKKIEVYTVYKRMATEYKQFTELAALYQQRIREGYSVGGIEVIPKEENHESRD
jgi:hypothetical protein